MAHKFKLSDFGLKLIKAYEGFRSAETTLVSGQRVIGYGHKYQPSEEELITRKKAETLLKDDLAPYEVLINENVFAPLSQSQFDALVSIAFNIGPKAFLQSNIIFALNNGRPLEAANGFDEWRKSVIDGKTYVVDALVRRRTAEKALFLRPAEGVIAAPRHELPPKSDLDYKRPDGDIPEFVKDDAYGIVDHAPYAAKEALYRRRDDTSPGVLTLSELAIDENAKVIETRNVALDAYTGGAAAKIEDPSPIAIAAAEVSERLDKLIADQPETSETNINGRATIKEAIKEVSQRDIESAREALEMQEIKETPKAANEGSHEDFRRTKNKYSTEQRNTARNPDRFIQKSKLKTQPVNTGGSGGYWTALVVGATLLASGIWKWFFAGGASLGKMGAFFAPVATFVGAMIVLTAVYYLLKAFFRSDNF